jgi:hypothetical protein
MLKQRREWYKLPPLKKRGPNQLWLRPKAHLALVFQLKLLPLDTMQSSGLLLALPLVFLHPVQLVLVHQLAEPSVSLLV